MRVGPGRGDAGVVGRFLGLGEDGAQHLGVAQRVLARAEVGQAGVDAGHDDRLAAAGAGRVEDVLERLGERALPEGHVDGLPGPPAGIRVGVGQRPAADAVFQDRQAGVDLLGFFHARRVVLGLVARRFGPGEIDQVQQTVVGFGQLWILETEPTDGVRPRGRVVLHRWCRAPKGCGRFNVPKESVLVADLVFKGAGHLGNAQRVFEDGDLLARVEKV